MVRSIRSSSLIRVLSLLAFSASVAATPLHAQTSSDGATEATSHWLVAPAGNEARYRVREQLLRRDLPNDAVGVTSRIEGGITVGPDGSVGQGSRFVINLADLTSDQDRRDNFLRRNTLATDSFPTAVFVPTAIEGLTLPEQGDASFRVTGDLTIRGVTRPVTWDATAHRDGDAVVGRATTRFPFSTFGLEIPKLGFILSVDDDIRLEYDFRVVPAS